MTVSQHIVVLEEHRYVVTLGRDRGRDWAAVEQELDDAGVALPLHHRALWLAMRPGERWVACARDEQGACACAFPLMATTTMAMPGHVVLRAERLGCARDARALEAAVTGSALLVRGRQEILRLELATFSFDDGARAAAARALRRLGFSPAQSPRVYARTARIDLRPSEDAILAGFHATARRHLRAVARHPVELCAITDPALAPRIEALTQAARLRTGGHPVERPWAELLRLAGRRPELVRFVGLFHRESRELLAYASGHLHGDHATYADAGSERRADLKLPLGYAPAWELMRWAKGAGASWFDFGGIATDTREGDVGGVNAFKRYFRGEEIDVADEYVLEPHPVRAAVANKLSAAAAWWRDRAAAR